MKTENIPRASKRSGDRFYSNIRPFSPTNSAKITSEEAKSGPLVLLLHLNTKTGVKFFEIHQDDDVEELARRIGKDEGLKENVVEAVSILIKRTLQNLPYYRQLQYYYGLQLQQMNAFGLWDSFYGYQTEGDEVDEYYVGEDTGVNKQ